MRVKIRVRQLKSRRALKLRISFARARFRLVLSFCGMRAARAMPSVSAPMFSLTNFEIEEISYEADCQRYEPPQNYPLNGLI